MSWSIWWHWELTQTFLPYKLFISIFCHSKGKMTDHTHWAYVNVPSTKAHFREPWTCGRNNEARSTQRAPDSAPCGQVRVGDLTLQSSVFTASVCPRNFNMSTAFEEHTSITWAKRTFPYYLWWTVGYLASSSQGDHSAAGSSKLSIVFTGLTYDLPKVSTHSQGQSSEPQPAGQTSLPPTLS